MRQETIADLRTIIAGGPDRQGGGDGPVVALLHGFGANGDDLVGLWRAMDVPRETRFAFPEAPLSLGGFGFPSFAWWMIDLQRWGRVMSGEVDPEEFIDERPEGIDEARAIAVRWLDALLARLGGVGRERLVLGGFSQGATLSLDLALHESAALPPPAGLALLSPPFVNGAAWKALAPQARGCPVFHAHGRRDPLIPFFAAEKLHQVLAASGRFPGPLVAHGGGHEIPHPVVQALGRFVRDCLGVRASDRGDGGGTGPTSS